MRHRSRSRRLRALLLLIWLSALLTGCWDRRDPEKMAWVTALGIDKGPQGDYIFTFQVPARSRGPGGGGGGAGMGGGGSEPSGGGGIETFAIEAPDIVTALDGSHSFVARRISLTHAKTVIIGEDVARDDVTPVLAGATRYLEFRRNMSVMVSRGKAADFLKLARPGLEANASRWYELIMLTQAQAGIIPETRINEFVMETEAPGVGAKATLVAVRPDIARDGEGTLKEDPPAAASGAPPPVGSAKAGEVRRFGEVPVEFMGAAIFKRSRLVGFLAGDEARFISMLRGEFKHASMAFVDPSSPDRRLVIRLRPDREPDLRVQRVGGQVRADFTIHLEGDLVSVHSRTDYSKKEQLAKLERSVSGELEKRMGSLLKKSLNEWGVDLFRISNDVRTTFSTVPEWEAFDWGRRVPGITFSVRVEMKVRRFGLQTDVVRPWE